MASRGRGLQGWVGGGASWAEVERRGALMGSGRLAKPAGGPQEALACGLALGRPATAAVRWADRLRRERRPSPCGLPSPPPTHPTNQTHTHTHAHKPIPSLCTDVWALGCNKLRRKTNKDGDLTSPSCTSERYLGLRRSN